MSYRREDTAYPAGWLYDRLAARFTGGQVFKDVDSIELGDDFVDAITAAVGSCDVLLAVIGDRWLTAADAEGKRRIDDANDFVRVEIEAALGRNVRVIPVLVDGASMPGADDLPASIAKLARRQALELSSNRFDADLGRLLRVLDKTLSLSRADLPPGLPALSGAARDEPGEAAIDRGGVPGIGHTALSEIIASRRQARRTADLAIRGLAEVADKLDMREIADNLHQAGEQLRSDTFKLIVMGRFKNGKTTLLNALLGGTTQPVALEGHKGPLPVDDLPATAILTGVRYAEKPYILAWGVDGKAKAWSFDRYFNESTLDADEAVNQRRFEAIREFEMGYPAQLCREGVQVYDSPGLDENSRRTLITREAAKTCDAAIIVYRSDTFAGQSELAETAPVIAEGTRVFTVVNRWNGRQVDDRLRSFVWNKYVRDHGGGPAWDDQDSAERDIYFVDAIQACDGRYDDDEGKVEASGLVDLERALARFLIEERQQVHLQKFATLAGDCASDIQAQILQLQKVTRLGGEELKTARAEAPPELAAIWACLAKLPKIFARHRAETEATLTSSFARLLTQIRTELPGHLVSVALPSGERYSTVLRQKKLAWEAAAAVSDFVTARIGTWSNEDVQAELAPILNRLGDEVESELAAVGISERIRGISADLVLDGNGGAPLPIAGAVSTSIALGLIGTSSVLFRPAGLAGVPMLGGIPDRRVKRKVLQQSDEILTRMPEESKSVIADNLKQHFELLETTITKEVRAVIDEEKRYIAKRKLNQSEQEGRDQATTALAEAETALEQHRLMLQRALVTSRKTG
jgi:hypothetical protein